jgi:hypothetical protein
MPSGGFFNNILRDNDDNELKFLETFKDGGDAVALREFLEKQPDESDIILTFIQKLEVNPLYKGYAERILNVINNNTDVFAEFISERPQFLTELERISKMQSDTTT